MDRWLNERGYTNTDYWYDIIGTHLLREMRFDEAHRWLAQVDPAYQHCLNTEPWMGYDPFQYGKVKMAHADNYKVRCAKRLMELEHQSREAASPDDRADAMLTLSIALRNAFSERCWPLVSYGYGCGFCDDSKDYPSKWADWYDYETPFEDPYYLASEIADAAVAPYAKRAEKCAAELRRKAFATYADPDRKAQGLKRVCEYTYLMKHYSDTPTGQYVASHCDKWKDYRIQ